MDVHGAIGVDGGGLAAEGGDFAEEADGLVGEGVEVLGVDAGGCFGGHGLGGLCRCFGAWEVVVGGERVST